MSRVTKLPPAIPAGNITGPYPTGRRVKDYIDRRASDNYEAHRDRVLGGEWHVAVLSGAEGVEEYLEEHGGYQEKITRLLRELNNE